MTVIIRKWAGQIPGKRKWEQLRGRQWDACVFRGHCYSLESSEITSRLPLKLSTLPTKLGQVRVQCPVEEVNGMLVNSCWTAIIRKWVGQIPFGE